MAVSTLAIGNGSGRVMYGVLSDKFGRKAVLMTAFLIQAVLIFILSLVVKGSTLASVPVLMLLVVLIGANYGANLAVFPAMTKDYRSAVHIRRELRPSQPQTPADQISYPFSPAASFSRK